jgi:tetratricopeptide (TPR) repeat protein
MSEFAGMPKDKRKITKKGYALIAVVCVTAIISISISTQISNAQNKDLVAKKIEAATKLIDKSDYAEARKILDQAIKIDGADASAIAKVDKRLVANKQAEMQKETAENLVSKRDFLGAIKALKTINESGDLYFKTSQDSIEKLKPRAEQQALGRANSFAKQAEFDQAISWLMSAKSVLGPSEKLSKRLTQIGASYTAYKKKVRTQAFSRLTKKYDSFSDITWYRDKSSPVYTNRNGFFLYFGVSNGSKLPLRLRVQYFDDDWLFVDSARLNIDGRVVSIDASNWERDNDHNIWEWFDEPLDEVLSESLIQEIIKSKISVIRFDGTQYYDTRSISGEQKRALQNVLNAYKYY